MAYFENVKTHATFDKDAIILSTATAQAMVKQSADGDVVVAFTQA